MGHLLRDGESSTGVADTFCQLNICNFLNLYVYQLVCREASESLKEPSYNKVESARYL